MNSDQKTIVALIALPEEFEAFSKYFPMIGDESTDQIVRLVHDSGRPDVRLISVLAESMGSQSALMSADGAISDFDPDMIVVIGIAGGISGDLTIGDVCISNEIIDVLHNSKISDLQGKTDITFAPDFYTVQADLVASFTFFKVHPKYKKLRETWTSSALNDDDCKRLTDCVRDGGPSIEIGPIACGPVVASPAFNAKLKALHRKVLAIETESGGAFGRLARAKIPAIAIRGISDMADTDKAELEARSKGGARRLAMANACRLLQQQLNNSQFIEIANRYRMSMNNGEIPLFPQKVRSESVISDLDEEITERLKERSPEFRAKPEGFYLPVPRAQKIVYTDEIASSEHEAPENLIDLLKDNDRVLIRLNRSYPSQALGWSLAHSLLRQQIDGKIVLPYVISGDSVNPPKSGLSRLVPLCVSEADCDNFLKVIIVEEPPFQSRNRMRYLSSELKDFEGRILVLTKTEDTAGSVEEFLSDNSFDEYQLSQVSFSETAYFLEKAFDMSAREAEAVAIRLDHTFKRFRLDAHPTYFAGLQEETLAALVNANKRAELIQLAVDAILTLIVAADKSQPPLSRTTRERFLKGVVIEMATTKNPVDEARLLEMAKDFLDEHIFSTSPGEFITPFFEMGLLYRAFGKVFFAHPYLESYLLAQALRENPLAASDYFQPSASFYNYYTFDLYCEMGPAAPVINAILEHANEALKAANTVYGSEHVYTEQRKLVALSSSKQLVNLSKGMMDAADKLENDAHDDGMRSEKQRLLDARQYVKSEVGNRSPERDGRLPEDVRIEFEILDNLSRALALCSTAIGSGSESLSGETKKAIGQVAISVASKFSDVWTRNRLRVDYNDMRNEVLSDENIWEMVEKFGADQSQFDAVKQDLQMLIHGYELNAVLEPMGRVLWTLSANAGSRVLAPLVYQLSASDEIERVIRSAWLSEVDPEKGRDSFKVSLSSYKGAPLLRVVVASHLLWRVFWHHYKTPGSRFFINSAKRALRTLGLAYSEERLESASKGVDRRQSES